jgi:diguanylate cyclase (GGDEF)-like protein/PAS domain S-box-containing protein
MKKVKRGPKVTTNRFPSARDRSSKQTLTQPSHYQSLFDSATFSIVETDLSGRIVDCNPALARMLLAHQDEFRACKILNFMPTKWHDKETSTSVAVIENGVIDEYEVELRKSDGTVFPVAIRKWLQTDQQGRAQGIWMLVREITDKKKNDDVVYQRAILLLENQIRYQSLLASVPIGVLTFDKTGRIDSVNPSVEELLGYTSLEMVGKKLEDFVISPSGHPLPIMVRQTHTGVAKCRDNRILPAQITFSELRTKGQVLYTCFVRDITVDVQMRETLQRAHEELEARVRQETAEIARLSDALQAEISERTWAQEQFRIAVESAPNGLLIIDQEGNIALVNTHIERLFGYSRDELMGRPVEILLPERFRKQPGQEDGLFASPNEIWMGQSRELYGLRKGDIEFPVEIGLNPINTPKGKGVLVAIVDITERKRIESELKRTAFHDTLTGLPNRTLFLDNLLRLNASAKRHGHHPFALLFLDLDRFKVINDTLGHTAGDKLLIEMSHRLVECTREEDTVARLGGDEFAILLEQIRGPEDAVRVAKRALERLADPLMLDDTEVSVCASIGIALSLTGEKTPEDLLRDADMAMYQAKTRRSGYQIFDAKMHARALERMHLEMDMKRAIERKQIHVHYQPIVSLENGKLVGFEALARWQHNGRGAVSPSDFIPLAEETGLVGPLSSWIFREACSQMRNWQMRFPLNGNCFISVNVSSKQVSQGGLVDELDEVLHETGLDPQYLRLEITESALVENARVAAHTLSQLRKRRIKLCLDDFGKGFSSLNYLHRFPIDVLKIDRSFVRRLGAALANEHGKRRPYEIIRTIVALAQILGLQVVAEGVEVTQQLNVLKEIGCHFGQGFLFAPALEATEAARFFDPATPPSEIHA